MHPNAAQDNFDANRRRLLAADGGLTRFFADTAQIEAERRRLIAFSLRAANGIDGAAAEEIAQEALTLAWQNRDRLRDAAAWQPWLTGITRNLCLRWRQASAIQARRSVDWEAAEETLVADANRSPTPDPYAELERSEREGLLDQALSRLPQATHSLLIDRYVRDMPVAEIAARRGVREETAAVQLFRSRAALKKTLTAPELREQALALGILPLDEAANADWQETRLWCPLCGTHRLRGVFGPVPLHNKISGKQYSAFILRCPSCHASDIAHSGICSYFYHPDEPAAKLFTNVKGYRAAFRRLATWFNDYAESAARTRTVPCCRCHRDIPVQNGIPPDDEWHVPGSNTEPTIYSRCRTCCRRCYLELGERSFVHPDAQKFWTDNPRMRMLPARKLLIDDRETMLTSLESVTGSATLDILCDLQTFATRSVRPGPTT